MTQSHNTNIPQIFANGSDTKWANVHKWTNGHKPKIGPNCPKEQNKTQMSQLQQNGAQIGKCAQYTQFPSIILGYMYKKYHFCNYRQFPSIICIINECMINMHKMCYVALAPLLGPKRPLSGPFGPKGAHFGPQSGPFGLKVPLLSILGKPIEKWQK